MRTKIERSESHTGIPYVAAERPHGRENHGYVDPKKTLNWVEKIPEIEDVPELNGLLRELNHSRSLFRSVGCDTNWGATSDDDVEFRFGMECFVTLVFEIVDWNNESNYQRLYEEFREFLCAGTVSLPDPALAVFEIHNVTFGDHDGRVERGLTVHIRGWGPNESQARSIWRESVALLQRFFADTRAKYQHKLDEGGITVT